MGKYSFPSVGTQPARLLAELIDGRKVDPLAGWRRLGIYRLSDSVLQLRSKGWPVKTGHLDVKNRFGEDCRVAEYFIQFEEIETARHDCDAFRAAFRKHYEGK